MEVERSGGSAAVMVSFPSGVENGRKIVLVVEDDPDCRTIYRTILLASGFVVVETANGSDSVRLAVRCAPDIILMDLGLPGIDGWSATRILKQQMETAAIPIIALTGYVFPEHQTRAREAGCVAFLAKPVEPRTVVAEVRRILSFPSGTP